MTEDTAFPRRTVKQSKIFDKLRLIKVDKFGAVFQAKGQYWSLSFPLRVAKLAKTQTLTHLPHRKAHCN